MKKNEIGNYPVFTSLIFKWAKSESSKHYHLCIMKFHAQKFIFMLSLCYVGVRIRVCVNDFSSKTTRPRDMLFLKDSLSIKDEKLFKACRFVLR